MPIRPLTYLGDRDAPSPLSDVYARRPLLGSGDIPRELRELALQHSFYVSAPAADRPEVSVVSVTEGDQHIWRINVPLDHRLLGHRPGLTGTRESPRAILESIDESTSFAGFRPDWADTLYVPRPAPAPTPSVLRRLDGRPVDPLWVFGNDDRQVFRDPSYPWGAVGRVFNNRGFSGTGTLVGERLVVTAGHMVPWGDNPWWMLFVPAYYDGSSLYGAGVQSYVSDYRGYDVAGNVTGYDWAVLRLYEPLGSSVGYLGYNGYSSSWNDQPYWTIVGYPGALANAMRPSYQGSITINDTDSDSNGGEELESETADLTPGNSGGPMFAWWASDPRVVGDVSGQETEYAFPFSSRKDNVLASGSGFTSLIAWGRTNWPA